MSSKIVKAPWDLRGYCYTFLVKIPSFWGSEKMFVPKELPESHGGFAFVMFVHYDSSDVGPYDELLFMPLTTFPFGCQKGRTISRIFVSSQPSVDSGRHNWGIPKELAEFKLDSHRLGTTITINRPGESEAFGMLQVAAGGFHLPVSLKWVPKSLRTLHQLWQNRSYTYTPDAKGRLGLCQLQDCWFDPAEFPAIKTSHVKMALSFKDFSMRFPLAVVNSMGEQSADKCKTLLY